MKRIVFAALALAGATFASPAAAQGGCNRELLQGIAGDWVSALEKGSGFEMELGEWVEFQTNLDLGSMGAFLDKPRKVDWHQAFLDTTSCKVMVESVILDEAKPMVLATVLNNGFFGVSPISTIVSTRGDWLFDAAATLRHASAEDWSPIPEGQRMTREQLVAVADAYLDRFSDPAVEVPFGTPCARLEGGTYIETCDAGMPDDMAMAERQYVVDPVLGAVNVQLRLGPDRLADSHTFRVEEGQIRYVHTVTNCDGKPNCGFPAAGQRS